jgi:hypothetical protein
VISRFITGDYPYLDMQKTGALRTRFFIEVVLGAAAVVVFVVTLVWNEWIELLLRIDPDAGNGSLEWAICIALLGSVAASWWLARAEWQRFQAATG